MDGIVFLVATGQSAVLYNITIINNNAKKLKK
jgi:hypothetical protein